MQAPSPVRAAIQPGDLETSETGGLAEKIGEVGQRAGMANLDGPAALRAACVVDPRPAKAKFAVDSTAKR